MLAEIAPSERDFRGPGCTDACHVERVLRPGVFGRSDLLLHDPEAHEAFGRSCEGMAGTVTTSGLVFNIDSLTVTVDGRAVILSSTELKLLVILARRIGRVVWDEDLVRWGLGAQWLDLGAASYIHNLRVAVSRLRGRLRPYGGLVVRIPAIGVRLDALPPDAPAPAHAWNALARRRIPRGAWSIAWASCRACGRTDRLHKGRGWCSRCYDRELCAARQKGTA